MNKKYGLGMLGIIASGISAVIHVLWVIDMWIQILFILFFTALAIYGLYSGYKEDKEKDKETDYGIRVGTTDWVKKNGKT